MDNPALDTGRGTDERGKVADVVWCQETTPHTTTEGLTLGGSGLTGS